MSYKRVAQLRTPADFREYLAQIGAPLDFDETVEHGGGSPLAQPYSFDGVSIGNRFTVLPMEGWDAERDGQPTDLVQRRWERFGFSGAKLIFGGEATAVRHDGRANPHQLVINDATVVNIGAMRAALVRTHEQEHGDTSDLLIGLQLTHSGRFARPNDKKRLEPQILYHHPLLETRYKLADNHPLMHDDEIDALIEDFVRAAVLAQQAGFAFVDVKHCHGYLGHEFLSAVDRPGKYGGSFENRTRFLRDIVSAIREHAPGLLIGVRLSAFDWKPFRPGVDGIGEPETWTGSYRYAFGGDSSGTGIDLNETNRFLSLLEDLNIRLVCLTAGSPYYNPHIQRPALFPPSDGYQPPEDPLCGVARQIAAVAELKRAHPSLFLVGSGYSYLQDWLPNVAQHVVRSGMVDSIGLGRMILSYPDMPADIIAGRKLQRKQICRTFSDCTTAPRNGLVSGCYPLDPFYKARPEADQLNAIKHSENHSSTS